MDSKYHHKIAIFGAGDYGRRALEFFGRERIKCFIDSDQSKIGTKINGVRVFSLNQFVDEGEICSVVIAVSSKYLSSIEGELHSVGITNYEVFLKIWQRKVKENIQKRKDYIGSYRKTLSWIVEHTIQEQCGKAIISDTRCSKGYPEVTGYYIPTLIRIGQRDLASDYVRWLLSIQKDDGSWYDTMDTSPYVFDTGQILKGLLAIRHHWKDTTILDTAIRRGCDWILGQMQADGRIVTPNESAVGNKRICSEAIHLYCLSPLFEAAELMGVPEYSKAAAQSKAYYLKYYRNDISEWHILTHFYAYVMEALLDLGEVDLANTAMAKVAVYQRENGIVPAYPDVHWTCSTGLFQLALVWFRLGEADHANRAFDAAINLQNPSGGWYGSYALDPELGEDNDYFPDSEISWVVKYFFDALYYKNVMDFNISSHQFKDKIEKTDGRYRLLLKNVMEECALRGDIKILDVGCSNGRYLKNLLEDAPHNRYYGVDIAVAGLNLVNESRIKLAQGTLTDIPYNENSFDVVFTCEALEHAIDIENAIRELARVAKSGGRIIVVDKSQSALGEMEITPWEQWFDEMELRNIMKEYCTEVMVHTNVSYEDVQGSNLFSVWVGKVK